jgi:hypothetical protein
VEFGVVGALRRISYTYRFAVPAVDGSISSEEEGDIADLLHCAEPHLFHGGAAPSLDILNHFFSTGGRDHGVSGAEWAPFTITAEEFDALLAFLDSAEGRAKFRIDRPVHVVATPADVRTVPDFHDWKIEEALKDPNHYLNNSERRLLVNGLFVTFPEYWASRKKQKA